MLPTTKIHTKSAIYYFKVGHGQTIKKDILYLTIEEDSKNISQPVSNTYKPPNDYVVAYTNIVTVVIDCDVTQAAVIARSKKKTW